MHMHVHSEPARSRGPSLSICCHKDPIVKQAPVRLQVLGVSRTGYSAEAEAVGASFYTCMDDFAEQHPDVVIIATSILSTRAVLEKLPLLRFRRSTLFVDVLSVKVFPKQVLLDKLPGTMDILCTHPMFGPDSGKGSWGGLNFQFEKVRIGTGAERESRAERFLQVRSLSHFRVHIGCMLAA